MMPGSRLSNYALAQQVAQLLRRLTAHGLTRDQQQAEALIRDLESRLCPHPPARRPEPPYISDAPHGQAQERKARDVGRRLHGAPNWRGK